MGRFSIVLSPPLAKILILSLYFSNTSAMGVSTTITEMSPYLSEIDDVYVSTNCVAPVQLRAGDVIQVFGVLIGNSSNACALINTESNINIVRIN
jgi:transcription termination factor Rho